VIVEDKGEIVHDVHAPVKLDPGTFQVERTRSYEPQEKRIVQRGD
jgi:hypothetical protein